MPSAENLARGTWVCVGGLVAGPCLWLYAAHGADLYLGRDKDGTEGWYGREAIRRAGSLWSHASGGGDRWMDNPIPLSGQTAIADAVAQSPARRADDPAHPRVQSSQETQVRTAIDISHAIGGIVLTAFGGGAAVKPLGDLEQAALDRGYGKR